MYRYLRAAICVVFSLIKFLVMKLFEGSRLRFPLILFCSPFTEVDIRGGQLHIGKGFKMRSYCHLRVRKGAILEIGRNVSLNYGNMLVCYERITIGDNVQFGPNVLVYDHDHDFRVEGGLKAKKFKTSPVVIGNNVWIGANVVILRGTTIGDNCVIGAGSVVKGNICAGTVFIQKRVQLDIK